MFFRLIIFFSKVLKAVTLGQAEILMFKEWEKMFFSPLKRNGELF